MEVVPLQQDPDNGEVQSEITWFHFRARSKERVVVWTKELLFEGETLTEMQILQKCYEKLNVRIKMTNEFYEAFSGL